MTNPVTLADGRQVPSDSPEWREECLARHRHVQNLSGRSLAMRREYLRQLERSAGAEMALRVADDYRQNFERRKAELQAITQANLNRKDGPRD